MTDASDQPAPGSTPKFEHAAIVREVSEIGPNHRRVAFEVPAEQVKRFIMQLREVKQDIHPQETSSLWFGCASTSASPISDRTSFFDPRLADDVPPPVLHPEKPFIGTIDFDAFAEPDWPDFSLLTLAGNPIEVTDELVEREMLDQRLDAGRRSPSTDPLVENDEIDAALEIRLPGEDKSLLTFESVTARIPAVGGPANLGGMLLAGLDAATGHVAGDSISFQTRLPRQLRVPRPARPGRRGPPVHPRGSPSRARDGAGGRRSVRVPVGRRVADADPRYAARGPPEGGQSHRRRGPAPSTAHRTRPDQHPRLRRPASRRRPAAKGRGPGEEGREVRRGDQDARRGTRPRLEKSAPRQATNRVLCKQLSTHLGVRVTEEEILQEYPGRSGQARPAPRGPPAGTRRSVASRTSATGPWN